jgi:hypothetical protein
LAFCTQGPHSSSPLALLSVAVRLSRIAYRTGLLPPARPTKVRSDRVQLIIRLARIGRAPRAIPPNLVGLTLSKAQPAAYTVPNIRHPASGELHHVGALANLAAKALATQISEIGFVVHDQDACATRRLPSGQARTHATEPVLVTGELRGRRMVNSVTSPTRLSTSIVPPCCWVTMS